MSSHLVEYLNYYESLSNPGYAVLVTGAWGVGKTFQIRQFYKHTDHCYVSLFGLKSVEDIHNAVFAASEPLKHNAKNIFKAGGNAGKDIGGLFALAAPASGLLTHLIKSKIDPTKTLIFDDLERCDLKGKALLGSINEYVEHHACRVVVIAHDEKLAKNFVEAKEKVFGHTVRAEAQIRAAFNAFLSSASAPHSAFLSRHAELLLSIFSASEVGSLRVLRQVTEDLKRLHDALLPKHFENPEGLNTLLSLFVAIGVEVRSGRISKKDLVDRRRQVHNVRLKEMDGDVTDTPPIFQASKRYAGVDVTRTILNDEVLAEMLVDGIYNVDKIRNSVDADLQFASPTELPAWKVVMQFDFAEDADLDAAMDKMSKQFEDREILDLGEMLHVFSLRLMFAENGVVSSSLEDVKDECLAYIKDLVDSERMPPRALEWRWKFEFDRGGSGGFAYWSSEKTKPYLVDLTAAINEAQESALRRRYPEFAAEVLSALKGGKKAFQNLICQTMPYVPNYQFIPVLASIDPVRFVDEMLSAPRQNLYEIYGSLQTRKESIGRGIGLEDEIEWFASVGKELTKRADAETGLAAMRIRRMIPR